MEIHPELYISLIFFYERKLQIICLLNNRSTLNGYGLDQKPGQGFY